MTKQQKEQFDNLYNFANETPITIEEESKEKKKKTKERQKRIKQKKQEQKNQFDLDNETVIGMTNKNNQKIKNNKNKNKASKQARFERKKKKIKKFLKFLTLVLIIIGGFVFAFVSPIFNINEITVKNNNQIATETIISLSELQKDQNIFRFSRNKIEDQIRTNPYIESVTVKRKIPNRIEITVEERTKNYNVEFLNGYAYINNQGYILEISEQKLDMPVIQGVSTEEEQIVAGNRLNSDDLEKLETVIQIMNICKNYELDNKITSINISNKNNYEVFIESENKNKEGTIYLNGDINDNFRPRFREKV